MESEVVENKGLPGNGLTDSVSPEEGEPLRSSNSKRSGGSKPRKEKISLAPSSKSKGKYEVEDDSGDEEHGSNRVRAGKLEACARKCRLTPKRALIYLLFSSFIIFLLLLILIIMLALWPSSPSTPVCHTAQCHAYSASILQSLNASAEPCQDVWEFACGGWLQANPIPNSRAYWDVSLQQQLKVKEKVRSLINTLPTNSPVEGNNVFAKMKVFYDSCMGLEYIEVDEKKPLQRIIKNLGGWHVLRDFRQNDFDFPRVLKKLHADHRVSPYFHVSVAPDPRVPSRNIIKIAPGGLTLADKKYYFELDNKVAEAFKFHVKDMVQILGANSVNAQQFASEVFNYERRIAEITPNPETLRDPLQTFQKMTVTELRAMSSTIFWPELLKSMFPQGNIHDQTQVLLVSKEYLIQISAIISSTDKQTQNNYLMWHLTKKYLPYLSKEYTEAYDMFLREITGRRQSLPRWEFCIDETMRFFRQATDFLLSQNCEHRADKEGKIVDMFESIQNSLTNRVNEAANKYDESMRNYFLEKLRLMSIHVGTPFQNGTMLKEYYFTMDVQKSEWFTNVRSAIEFQATIDQRLLSNNQREAPIIQVLSEHPNDIQFLPTNNQVIVPESVLQREVLQLGATHLPLLLGSVGVELGEAVARAFGIKQGLYGSGGNLMSDKDIKTDTIRELIEQRRTCLVSYFNSIHLDEYDYLNRTSLDTTIHLAGLQVALDTLQNHELTDTFLGLPALENFPSNALFFLSYVQSQCSVQTLLYSDLEHYAFETLSHDHRTKGLLRQMVAFTEAMECPTSTELYADFSCGTII